MQWCMKTEMKHMLRVPTPEIYHYMEFRADKENTGFELDEKWFKVRLAGGFRKFFGVNVNEEGDVLDDLKNQIWLAEFKSG